MVSEYNNVSFEELVALNASASMDVTEELNQLGKMLTAYENLITITDYIKAHGVTRELVDLVDANGEVSALLGVNLANERISNERLDDAITELGVKIGAFFSHIGNRIGHKISTWLPTINRYEIMFDTNVKKLGGKAPNPAWVERKVRGISKTKMDEILKRRKEGLDALKEFGEGMKGGVEKMLTKYNDTVIGRLGGLFALYKKDGLIQKLFMKERISSLGYTVNDYKLIIKHGEDLKRLISEYRTVGPQINKSVVGMDEGIRKALNAGDTELAKSLNRRIARVRGFIFHMINFWFVSLDQMCDELAFCAYAVKEMAKVSGSSGYSD